MTMKKKCAFMVAVASVFGIFVTVHTARSGEPLRRVFTRQVFKGFDATRAGVSGEHGVGATKGCAARCVAEASDCTATVRFLDQFDDAIVVTDAFDEVLSGTGTIRIPAVGNLPIIAVIGNAVCTDDGGICDSITGANCALPCTLGGAGSTVEGEPGQILPGIPQDGRVRFAQNEYIIQPEDMGNLPDTVFFTWRDVCNSGVFNCPQGMLTTPAGSSTVVPNCDDNNVCTADSCQSGTCQNVPECDVAGSCDDANACTNDLCTAAGCCLHIPDCTSALDCDDQNECTTDVCIGECCENRDISCDDQNACTADSCDPTTGCVNEDISASCDDGDACTADSCDPVSGCVHTDTSASCDDQNACTADSCDPVSGCVHTDTSASCDDQNACTADSCDPTTGCVHEDQSNLCDDGNICTADSCDPVSGCVHTDTSASCDDQNACTIDSCDPVDGCKHVAECTSNADCDDGNACTDTVCTIDGCCKTKPVSCDDGDPCTADTCDPNGGCVNTLIDPPPAGCGDFAGCTPGFWKQPQHLQFWVNHAPSDLFDDVFGVSARPGVTLLEALETGGGGDIALGRHAVAALLDAASDQVNFKFTEAEIIEMVQTAYDTGDFETPKNVLAEQNELGCTIDKGCTGEDCNSCDSDGSSDSSADSGSDSDSDHDANGDSDGGNDSSADSGSDSDSDMGCDHSSDSDDSGDSDHASDSGDGEHDSAGHGDGGESDDSSLHQHKGHPRGGHDKRSSTEKKPKPIRD